MQRIDGVTHQLICDGVERCHATVTHIDNKGYVYCTEHGLERRMYRPCRKLRAWEMNRLRKGEPLRKY